MMLIAVVLSLVILPFADAPGGVGFDTITLLRAEALYQAGELDAAEPLLSRLVQAIDAGAKPRPRDLVRCFRPLIDIYFTAGRHEDVVPLCRRLRQVLNDLNAASDIRDNAVRLAESLAALGRYDKAEQSFHDAMAVRAREAMHPLVELRTLMGLVSLSKLQGRPDQAKPWLSKAEAVARHWWSKSAGMLSLVERVQVGLCLAACQQSADKFAQAEEVLRAALALHERCENAANAPLRGELLAALAACALRQGKRVEARVYWDQAVSHYQRILKEIDRSQPTGRAGAYRQLQSIFQQTGEYSKAIALLKQRISEVKSGPELYRLKADLGVLHGAVGSHEQASALLREVVRFHRSRDPGSSNDLFGALYNLATVELTAQRFDEAESLCNEALALGVHQHRTWDLSLANCHNILATVWTAKGRYALAHAEYEKALEACDAVGPGADGLRSIVLANWALAYKSQGLYARAAQACQDSLEVHRRLFGPDAPAAALHYNILATVHLGQGNLALAREAAEHARQLAEKATPPNLLATAHHHLAAIDYIFGQYGFAQAHWRFALALQVQHGAPLAVARTLNYLARLADQQGDVAQAEALYRNALDRLQGDRGAWPATRFITLSNLADVLLRQKRGAEARPLLQQAIDLTEGPRSSAFGAEIERAEYFAQFASAFELLVDLQLRENNVEQALQTAERARSRTFLDQLGAANLDPRDGLEGPGSDKLLAREHELQRTINRARARARETTDANDRRRFQHELQQAQAEYAELWARILSKSPAYWWLARQREQFPSLARIRKSILSPKDLVLYYFLGRQVSYIIVFGASGEVEFHRLELTDKTVPDLNRELEREAGAGERSKTRAPGTVVTSPKRLPITVSEGPFLRRGAEILVGAYVRTLRGAPHRDDRAPGGIVQSPKTPPPAAWRALTEVVLPERVRLRIQRDRPERLVIVPDGALHQLPFEALILDASPSPRYVVDEFPAIAYAPSASSLAILMTPRPSGAGSVSVLTVGNAAYEGPATPAIAQQAPGVRDTYLELGGTLAPLPNTLQECRSVAAAFRFGDVCMLEGANATERNVANAVAGRRFVHLALHGMVDERYDNLFGALALAPPPREESSLYDGLLSLHEVYRLPMSGCELAVLSACDTNVGPFRPLEAGSSLASAFLAAGARRVVCSHWKVSDASTAELVGSFFEDLARRITRGEPIDYAAALQQARKRIRRDPRWSAPYYWAPFVLLGPAR